MQHDPEELRGEAGRLLAIRAKGFKPFQVDIAIEAETKQTLLLDPE